MAGLGIDHYSSENSEEGVEHDMQVGRDYKEYGIPKEHIGKNQGEVIGLLRQLGPHMCKFLQELGDSVQRAPHNFPHEKADLLKWLI